MPKVVCIYIYIYIHIYIYIYIYVRTYPSFLFEETKSSF